MGDCEWEWEIVELCEWPQTLANMEMQLMIVANSRTPITGLLIVLFFWLHKKQAWMLKPRPLSHYRHPWQQIDFSSQFIYIFFNSSFITRQSRLMCVRLAELPLSTLQTDCDSLPSFEAGNVLWHPGQSQCCSLSASVWIKLSKQFPHAQSMGGWGRAAPRNDHTINPHTRIYIYCMYIYIYIYIFIHIYKLASLSNGISLWACIYIYIYLYIHIYIYVH